MELSRKSPYSVLYFFQFFVVEFVFKLHFIDSINDVIKHWRFFLSCLRINCMFVKNFFVILHKI